MFQNLNISALAPVLAPAFVGAAENFLGITPTQALAYLQESESENPGQTMDFYVQDATGKFKHGLRDGELPVKLGSLVDGVWDEIEPFCNETVKTVSTQVPPSAIAATAATAV